MPSKTIMTTKEHSSSSNDRRSIYKHLAQVHCSADDGGGDSINGTFTVQYDQTLPNAFSRVAQTSWLRPVPRQRPRDPAAQSTGHSTYSTYLRSSARQQVTARTRRTHEFLIACSSKVVCHFINACIQRLQCISLHNVQCRSSTNGNCILELVASICLHQLSNSIRRFRTSLPSKTEIPSSPSSSRTARALVLLSNMRRSASHNPI